MRGRKCGWRILHEVKSSPQSIFGGLLACNRRTNTEVTETLARAPSMDYKFDIMIDNFMKEEEGSTVRIWPTWILFPGPITNTCELVIDFRIFGQHQVGPRSSSSWDLVHTPLFIFLNGLLYLGPQYMHSRPSRWINHIETLTITLSDELTPVTATSNAFGSLFRKISMLSDYGALAGKISKI